MSATVAIGNVQKQGEVLHLCFAALAAAHILKLLRPPIQPATGCLPFGQPAAAIHLK